MMRPDVLRIVATAFAAGAMLAGCAGGGTFAPARDGTDSVRRSAAGNQLLFVSDTITSEVYVYSYPQGKLAYTLSGFTDPAGECVASNGDVFITNTGASNILEFAPNSQYPLEQLKDPGYFPVGCSVDPATGNLAVTNFSPSSSILGDVVIYKHAKGRPTGHYTDPNLAQPSLCGYDGTGNLFVDGQGPSSGAFAFAELPKGGNKLRDVTLDQPIAFGGAVQWDGKYVAVGDQSNNTIYRFAISGRTGTKAGKTVLRGATQIFQFWIQGSKVIGADAYGGDVGKWQYPAGGRPVKVIGGLYAPLGVTISVSSTR